MASTTREVAGQDDRGIAEKKRLALAYLTEAWDEAIAKGVDPEIVAHAALFTAFADLIADSTSPCSMKWNRFCP